MSFRFDSPLITNSFHFGNRGLGVKGSEAASTGPNGPGYFYEDLDLPADSNKEYMGRITAPPGVGTFISYEDGSFLYAGPSTNFTYELYEDGVSKGTSTVTIDVLEPSASISWTEVNDTFSLAGSASDNPTINLNWTESDDSFNLSTSLLIGTTVSFVEVDDTFNIGLSITTPAIAELSWAEANDTFSLSGNVLGIVAGAVTWLEEEDTAAISVTTSVVVAAAATISWTESDDSFNISGLIRQPAVASISWVESNDIFQIITTLPSVLPPLPSNIQVKFRNPKYKITFRRI